MGVGLEPRFARNGVLAALLAVPPLDGKAAAANATAAANALCRVFTEGDASASRFSSFESSSTISNPDSSEASTPVSTLSSSPTPEPEAPASSVCFSASEPTSYRKKIT